MSTIGLSSALGRTHPAVVSRRRHDLLVAGSAGALAAAIGLGIALDVPNPNFFLAAGILVGAVGLIALAASARYEVTLALLALYLGMVDGVIKLETASQAASSIRDILIATICVGALVRLAARRERVRFPPLSGWVIAYVALVLVEAANPNTHGILKIIGGFRQQLEWIPFFFFGYLVMRSKERFRGFFLILGVVALANGLVGAVQTQLTPTQLSSWGPGYAQRVNGTDIAARAFTDSEGVERVRPPALGSDEGFGGAVGVMALSGALVLLATGRLHRRWPALLLCLGAVLAIATSESRTSVLGGVFALLAFALLSFSAGRRATRALIALLVAGTLAFALASVLVPAAGKGVFDRYASIAPDKAASTSVNYREGDLAEIPSDIRNDPFGQGLATTAAATGFGGESGALIEGRRASAESQYNYITLELGLAGLLLWIALSVKVIVLGVRRLRRIGDIELRLSLAAIFATLIAFTIMGFSGPTTSSIPFGPFFWFAVGIAAYWFSDGREREQAVLQANPI